MKKSFSILSVLMAAFILASACDGSNPQAEDHEETVPDDNTESSMSIRLIIGEQTVTAEMEDNGAARDFMSRLPLEVTLEDFNNGTEKIFYPEPELSLEDTPRGCDPVPGDITIYEPWDNVAIFCRDWSEDSNLIKIGHIDDISLLDVSGDVTVRFETAEEQAEQAAVYFTHDITPEGLIAVYEALGREASGNVAVKISTGEPGGHNYLQPSLIRDLVERVDGTIVECNTAYGGGRSNTEAHLRAAAEHGFTDIATVDIMDADGEIRLPVEGGRHITYDIVGSHFADYDFTVVLSHFKGHAMAGFGGALKNISIGIASSNGKRWIHSGGESTSSWGSPSQETFLETMAEAAKAVADHCGDNILYINVANNLSVDCDCDSSPAEPRMGDIGILASLDPVALDQACTDLVRSSDDSGKVHLIERIDSRQGMHILEYAEQIGLGTRQYELINLD